MPITLEDLTVNFAGIEGADLVEDWRWLVGEQRLPILLTALGTNFLRKLSCWVDRTRLPCC